MQTTENIVTADAVPTPDEVEGLQSAEERRKKYRAALKEGQRDKDTRLKAFLLEKRKHFRVVDADARSRHLQDIDMMCRYYNGDQYGDYVGGTYQPYTPQDGDYAYTIPVINGHVDQAFMQLLKTRIEYEFVPTNESDPNARSLSAMCEQLAVEEKDRLMTEDARADEILNSILDGESYRCLTWAVNPESPRKAKRLRYKQVQVTIPGRRECEGCGADAPAGAACECGATLVREIPPAVRTDSVEDGETEIRLGENTLHIPYLTAVKRSLTAQKLRHSTFIVERDYLPRHVAEWQYQTRIETGSEGTSEEVRIRQEQERSSMQVDALVGSGREPTGTVGNQSNVERERVWMDVSEYGHFYLGVAEQTPDGKTLAADTFLGEHYPEGCYVVYLGDEIVQLEGRNKNRQWSVVLYGKRPGSGRGAGLQNLIPLQDIVNDDFNQSYAIRMTSARPLTVVNRQAVKELPEAGQFLFIDKLPSGANSMNGAVAQYPGQTVPNDGTTERIEAAMQWIAGTASLMGSLGGADQRAMGTATGIAAATENAAGRMIGPIKQSVTADKELMFQILENIKEHSAPEQREELKERFGPDTVEYFFHCNFRQSLRIVVAQNTDMPRSMALTQANMMAFGNVAAGLAQAPWGAELLATMADTLGISFSIGQGRNDRKEAEYRLNKLAAIEAGIKRKNPAYLADTQRAAEQMFLLLSDFCAPLIPQADPAVDDPFVFMQEHQSFMDAYKDWLFGEQSKTASKARRMVVIQLFMEHLKAQMGREFETAAMQKEMQDKLNPPPPMPPEPAPEELAAQQGEADERALLEATLEHETDEESKDNELERDLVRQEQGAMLKAATRPQNGARG